MNEVLLNEFKSSLKIFNECGASISDDMKTDQIKILGKNSLSKDLY